MKVHKLVYIIRTWFIRNWYQKCFQIDCCLPLMVMDGGWWGKWVLENVCPSSIGGTEQSRAECRDKLYLTAAFKLLLNFNCIYSSNIFFFPWTANIEKIAVEIWTEEEKFSSVSPTACSYAFFQLSTNL